MYSDLMESPAKDCFSFTDQSSFYNMAEMNEINNQTNLDYFFNTYYSSVSRYNTDFELAEDCKNMSFSELFDQELFSSQENKDCKFTIKIEKEDPLIPCYTVDDSLDTTDSYSLIKIDENVPSSSSYSKSFAPKRGINRTSIKTNDNRDVQNLISNPFCETEDIGINHTSVKIKTSIINHEPKDINDTIEQNIVGIRVKPCYSKNSPNTIDSNNSDNIDDNFLSLLPNCSTPIPQGIIRTSIKSSDNCDVQHLINNPFSETEDLGIRKLPIIKHEPKDANNTIDQNIVKMQVNPFFSHGSQNLNNINNFGINEVNNLSLLPKHQSIKKTPIQIIKNSNIQHPTNNTFCKTDQGIDKPSMKFKIPIVKREPKHINDTNVQNTIDSYNLDTNKVDNLSLPKNLGTKYIKKSMKMSKNSVAQQPINNYFCNTAHLDIDEPLMKIKMPMIKLEPEDTSDTVEQNTVGMQTKSYSQNSQNLVNSYNLKPITNNDLSSLPKHLVSKHQLMKNVSIQKTTNTDDQHLINNLFCKTVHQDNNKPLIKIKKPIVKLEPEDVTDIGEHNTVGIEVNLFSSRDSQNVSNRQNFVKLEDNKSFISTESLAPKRQGITKPSIIKNNNSNVLGTNKPLIKIKKPIVKLEPENVTDIGEHNTVGIEVNLFSSRDSQNVSNRQNFVKLEDKKSFISTESLAPKRQGITKPSIIKNNNSNVLGTNKPLIKIKKPIVKLEPENVTDIGEHNTVGIEVNLFSSRDSQNVSNRQNFVKLEDNKSFISTESLAPKRQGITKPSIIKNNNSNVLGTNKPLIKIKKPIVKLEPENVTDIGEHNTVGIEVNLFSSRDSQNVSNRQNFVKLEDNKSFISTESLTPKRQGITKPSIIKNNNSNVRQSNSCKTVDLGINQPLLKLQNPIVKCKLENVTNTDEQTNSHNFGMVENSNSFSPSDRFVPKRQGITKVFINMTKNVDVTQSIYNPVYKTEDLIINQPIMNPKNPIVKSEPEDVNDTYEQDIVGMEVVKIKEENIGLNNFYCTNLKNINIKSNEVVNSFKKEDIVISNVISLNEDNNVTTKTKNEINLETEKKKISWEEFKAKREKQGLLTSENDSETAELYALDNDTFADVKEEFNRNTEEHFIDGKRKIEEKEEKITTKEISNEEDELQKKRMKIEYIKKLLPSSFASEIAKTSSLMKGSSVEIKNESTLDDSIIFNDKIRGKYTDAYEDLCYLKKDEKSQKKDQTTRTHSSHYSSRSDYAKKSSRSSSISSGSDDYYNRNSGQYSKSARNTIQRPKKKVVYVGQIPIKLGKGYLYKRFKKFGTIQSLTLHKKPDFRVYYAFVTYSDNSEAERAISHGNNDEIYQLDIRFGERKQTQVPYYDLDDEWLTDWYGYNNQPLAVVSTQQSPEKTSFEEELQEFSKLAQIKKKINQIKPSQVS